MNHSARLPALALAALGALASHSAALADDAPPASAPGDQGPGGRHHNPAWAACKKQADDQKLQPGDARREFMKNCMKSAKGDAPPAS
jgi:Spy/CpxP family protein refolding chaperone